MNATKSLPPPLDARFENNGTIWLFRPVTQAARDWLWDSRSTQPI